MFLSSQSSNCHQADGSMVLDYLCNSRWELSCVSEIGVFMNNGEWKANQLFSFPDCSVTKLLMFFRQQLNYFVCTLQQYVQSQLSHVSWCNFIQSLRNQVILFLTQYFAGCLFEPYAFFFFLFLPQLLLSMFIFFQVGHRYTGSGVFAYVLPSRCAAHVSDNAILWC